MRRLGHHHSHRGGDGLTPNISLSFPPDPSRYRNIGAMKQGSPPAEDGADDTKAHGSAFGEAQAGIITSPSAAAKVI